MKQRLTNNTTGQSDLQSTHVGRQSAGQSLEFESAESAIRHDAALTVVPAQLRERLLRDVARESAPVPWWKRWFGS